MWSKDGGRQMNELTKTKYRILARIENYIGDIEFAEEKELTEDEKTIFASVKHIINEEFDRATLEAPLPRFIIDEDEKIKQLKTSDEDMFEDMVLALIEALKKPQTNTAKWVAAGIGIDCMGNRFKEYKCSNCGNIDLSHRKNKFCPECGRRMEG
jgi:rubrerythrin